MKRAAYMSALLVVALLGSVSAQQLTSGKNVNVVGGPAQINPATKIPDIGDPYLNRQNEPSMACSSRNPLNCLAGGNDYRRLDFPGVQDGKVTGDAWLGTFWTRDGGNTWRSTLLPGFAEDASALGQTSPAYGFEAAADPMVRTGTNGLFYYSGIAFNRSAISANTSGAEGKDGVMFVATYIDDNNTQTVDTPFRYLGTSPVAYSNSAKFLDKPGLAVDIPRMGSGSCTIPGTGAVPAQTFPAGNVYVAYAAFMGDSDNIHTKIQFHRSTDCGRTWSGAAMLSETFQINQSPSIAIDPKTGRVFVAWRELSVDKTTDRMVVAVSSDLGKTFAKGVVVGVLTSLVDGPLGFDQPTLPVVGDAELDQYRLFRTNSYPSVCVGVDSAGTSRAYVAWAQRGFGPTSADDPVKEARIVFTTSTDGAGWSMPAPVEPLVNGAPYQGHQFMPALACAGDRVTALWYDQRADEIASVLPIGSAFAPLLLDLRPLLIPTRTLDVRAAHAKVGHVFEPSVPVTRYPVGVYMDGETPIALQLQYNLENLPMFGGGVVPFIGDYIDLAPATVFQPATAGAGQAGATAGATFKNPRRGPKSNATEPNGWEFNTTAEGTPPFHAVWTDNRDVVAGTPDSPIDQTLPPCSPGTQGGSKNQNIYTSRLTSGLVAGVLGNARPLGPELRAFSVFVQNLTPHRKKIELRIANQPVPSGSGHASFIQFPADPPDPRFPFPLVALVNDFAPGIAPFSAVARTVFVSGTGNSPIRVDVDELLLASDGTVLTGADGKPVIGQQLFAMINPDPTNPAPLDPSLVGAFNETHDSFVALTSITDYDLLNPTFLNPNFLNPTFLNPNFLNPNFLNPTFLNPTFLNPNFLNPNFLNPNFLNATPTLTEITWDVAVEGNTSSSYLLALLSSMNLPSNWASQLLIYRVYLSPWGGGYDPATGDVNCGLGKSEQHDLLVDVLNPNFLNPNFLNTDFSNPNFLNTALSAAFNNPTFSLSSGDGAKIVLRVVHDGSFQPSFVTAVVIPEAVDTEDAAQGETTPTVSPTPLTFSVAPTLPSAAVSNDYSTVIGVVGGSGPGTYTWSDTTPIRVPCVGCPVPNDGIPPGLALDTATGTVSGTPTASGTWQFSIQVTDASSPQQVVNGSFQIIVNEQLLIATTAIPSAAPATAYSTTLQAVGGVAPYTWTAVGALPTGITLSPAGVLSGTTTERGAFPFTASVIDAQGQTGIRPLTLVVTATRLTFTQQPSDSSAGAPMAPLVAVLVQDATGGVVPGVNVSIALATNPTSAKLGGSTVALTNAAGVATFAGLNVSADGEGYTLAASASGGATAVSNTFNVGSISFEMFPDGSPACNGCAVTTQFGNRGVVFSFSAFVDPEVNNNVTLIDSTPADPVGPTNHSIRNPGTVGGGFTGTMHMDFAGTPQGVRFRVRAPTLPQDTFVPFDVTAFDQGGEPISSEQISRTGGLYTPSSACCGQYREEVLTIRNSGGISRVSVDAGFGNIFVDNLAFLADVPLLDLPPPTLDMSGDFIDRGFYHPAYPGQTLNRVDLWLSTFTAGTYTVAMTARQGTYDGAIIGSSSVTVALTPGQLTPVSFDFGVTPVVPDSLVTFSMTQVSPTGLDVYYAVNSVECPGVECITFNPIIETEGTTPPLDTLRRNGVHLRIFGQQAPPSVVGPVGGNGGAAFAPVQCPAGSVATALQGRAGDDIDRTELWCSPISGTTLGAAFFAGGVGGTGGGPYNLSCPAGSAITGVHGLVGVLGGNSIVDTLGVSCRDIATGDFFTSGTVGIASQTGPPFQLECPAGKVVAGFEGRQGNLLDQVSIRCQIPR